MQKDQKGFNPILLIIAIFVLMAFFVLVGWNLWNVNHKQNSSSEPVASNEENHNTTQVNEQDVNSGYVVIPEWGVRFKSVEGLSGVEYFKTSSAQGEKLDFSTDGLIAIEPNCAKRGPVSVVRTQTPTTGYEKLLGNFNGFYYYFLGSDAACSDNATNFNTESNTRQLLTRSLNSLSEIKK